MTAKYVMFYFSGTGNTEYVVNLLTEQFTQAGITTDLVRIEDVLRKRQDYRLDDYDQIGIAHPVLGFDTPGIVYDFVRTLPDVKDRPVFLVKTAGDYHSINNGASKSVTGILARKGYKVFFDDIFAMPVNWLMSYDDQLSRQLVEGARAKVKTTARQIISRESKTLHIGFIMRWLMRGIGILEDRYGAKYFGQYLRTSSACTLCKKCLNNCPVSNITEANEKIVFGRRCVWCMRCIYSCPVGAIDNKYMNIFILKGGYSLKRILRLEHRPIDFRSGKIPFWHGYFRNYFMRLEG